MGNQLRKDLIELAIELLDSDHGVSEKKYSKLLRLLESVLDARSLKTFVNRVRSSDNVYYLPSYHKLKVEDYL